MSTFKNKNSLRTSEAQIVQKLKNNEARPKFTGSYKKKKKRVYQSYRSDCYHTAFRIIYAIMNIFQVGKTAKALDSDSVCHRCQIISSAEAGVRVYFKGLPAEWDRDFDFAQSMRSV